MSTRSGPKTASGPFHKRTGGLFLEVGEEQADISEEADRGANRDGDLQAMVPPEHAGERERHEQQVKAEVGRRRQAVIEDQVLADARHQHRQEKAVESSSILAGMLDEIDSSAWLDVGKDQSSEHVEKDHLEEDHRERKEVPMGFLAKIEARPPGLGGEQEDEDAPDKDR